MEVIIKNWEHDNRSLGKHIRSKRHYYNEMARQGMVSQEKGNEIAQKAKDKGRKDYTPSKDHIQFLNGVRNRTDKHGKVKLSGREIEYMKRAGCQLKRPDYRGLEGGFNAV